jgi:hypothetical protein
MRNFPKPGAMTGASIPMGIALNSQDRVPTLIASWKQRGLDPPTALSQAPTNNWQDQPS